MRSAAARSLLWFAGYLGLAGLLLIVRPEWLLGPLGLPAPTDVWGRMAGLLALLLGLYYGLAAWHEGVVLMRASVWLRGAVLPVLSLFVALGWAPPALLLLGAVDLLAALWTASALRHAAAMPAR